MNKLKSALAAAAVVVVGASPVLAELRSNYKYETDRFNGSSKAVAHFSNSNCQLTKRLKGELFSCFMIMSDQYKDGATITFMKSSRGWDLMHFSHQSSLPAIITYKSGRSETTKLDTVGRLGTDVIYGGTVSEDFTVNLGAKLTGSLNNVASIDIQYASTEVKWIPDRKAICAARVAPSC